MWVQPVPKDADFRSQLLWRECSVWSHMHRLALFQPGSRHPSLHVAHVIAGFLTTQESKLIQITQHKHAWTFFHRFKPLSQWSGVSHLCLFFLYLCVTLTNVLDLNSKWKLGADNISDQQIFNKFEYNWLKSCIKRNPLLFRMFIKVILLEQEYCIIPPVWPEKHVFIAQIKLASS